MPQITGISWDASANIQRYANESDNWPTAWRPGGELFAAYGDGYGFDDTLSNKLGLGFAEITGHPNVPDVAGTNVSSNGEETGDGVNSRKASGLISVGGTLYMWLRNADQTNVDGTDCQIAKSTDGGVNWTYASWTWPFGWPAFIDFGQDATHSDGYLYMITFDGASAYTMYDDYVLARCDSALDPLTEANWEWWDGSAWTSTMANRASILNKPGECGRHGVSYNAPLDRYMWYQVEQHPTGDERFDVAAMWVYEAPEPWGPWTLVTHEDPWDVAPGESGHFPPKYVSGDGLTVWLVFSNNDQYSLRQATLSTDPGAEVDHVESGSATLAAGSALTTVTLNTTLTDTGKAILLIGNQPAANSPGEGWVSGQIISTTQIELRRGVSTGAPAITVQYHVVEFTQGVNVQRGSESLGALAGPVDVTITEVNEGKAFPIFTHRNTGGTYSGDDYPSAEITAPTTLQFDLMPGVADFADGMVAEWQVIEFVDSRIQNGVIDFASGDASLTDTLVTVDPAKSLLFLSYQVDNGTGADIGQKLFGGEITDANTVTISRDNTGVAGHVYWYVVEFLGDYAVQRGTASFTTSQLQDDVTIASVDLGRTVPFAVGHSQRMGKTAYSADDDPTPACFTFELTTATNLQVTRGAHLSTAADVQYNVVQFPLSAVTGQATLSGAGALSAAGLVEVQATAAISGTGDLAAPALVVTDGAALLSGAGSLTAAGLLEIPAAASLSGAGDATAAGLVEVQAAATLSGLGDLTALGTIGGIVVAQATLSGAGDLTATGLLEVPAAASLSGAGDLTAVGAIEVIVAGQATLSGAGALASAGLVAVQAVATLSGAGDLAATAGPVIVLASASLSGLGDLTATSISRSTIVGQAVLSAAGDLVAVPIVVRSGSAALSAAGALAGTSIVVTSGASSLSGAGALASAGLVAVPASAALSGSGDLTALGSTFSIIVAQASLSAAGALTVAPIVVTSGTSILSGAGALAVAGVVRSIIAGQASLSAAGALVAVPVVAVPASAALSGAGTLSAAGVRAVLSGATLSGAGDLAAVAQNIVLADALFRGYGATSIEALLGVQGAGSLAGAGDLTAQAIVEAFQTPRRAGAGADSRRQSVPHDRTVQVAGDDRIIIAEE